ncbi:hypothetical protein [Vibrio sp.]|uniref:hypothetical protein n=1 Tax=Vibrio sp. TaxID=678 RepID=UPI003D0F657F
MSPLNCQLMALAPLSLSLMACAATPPQAPESDYPFSDQQLQQALQERLALLGTVSVRYGEQTYDRILASEVNKADLASGHSRLDLMVMLASQSGQYLVLRIKEFQQVFEQKSECELLLPDGDGYSRSKVTCQLKPNGEHYSAQLDNGQTVVFTAQPDAEYIYTIGSVLFKVEPKSSQPTSTIRLTSYSAFDPISEFFTGKRQPGSLGSASYLSLKQALKPYPGQKAVLTIANQIRGSVDDEINMFTGLLLRKRKVDTYLSYTGRVASGGVDLFSAGAHRTIELAEFDEDISLTERLGVHSWRNMDTNLQATEIPFDNDSHYRQASYFNQMLGSKGVPFYLYTINVAPADSMHYMTRSETEQYRLVNEFRVMASN